VLCCAVPVKQDLFLALTLNNSRPNSELQNMDKCVFLCVYNNLINKIFVTLILAQFMAKYNHISPVIILNNFMP
jgi:hypothetical protein